MIGKGSMFRLFTLYTCDLQVSLVCLVFSCLTVCRSKTPGGRLVYLYVKKKGTVPKCGDCRGQLRGVRNYVRFIYIVNVMLFILWYVASFPVSICSGNVSSSSLTIINSCM